MIIEEIELQISGNKDDIEKMLLDNKFEIFYKVLTISDYYLPINEDDSNHKTLKEKCKRIRYVEPVYKFKNKWHIDKCIKEEKSIIDEGYKKIYTDIKTDYVYKNAKEDDMYFQIQNIKNDCLMIAYDNKKYYNIESKEQRKILIQDVIKYGIKILSEDNIDRFKLIGQTLSIKEIIDIMENEIEKILN